MKIDEPPYNPLTSTEILAVFDQMDNWISTRYGRQRFAPSWLYEARMQFQKGAMEALFYEAKSRQNTEAP